MRISNTFGPAGMLLLVLFIEWSAVKAADFHVAKGDVYGSKGLVAAIMMANRDVEPDNIILETGEYVLTKPDNNTDGPNGLPDITTAITISARMDVPNAWAWISRRSEPSTSKFRIFHVSPTGVLALISVNIRDGIAQSGNGGAVLNQGKATILFSDVVHNAAFHGGGIFNGAPEGLPPSVLVLGRCTVDSNTSDFDGSGGGIFNSKNSTSIMMDTNIFSNENDAGGGGGIANLGTMTIENSLISGNRTGAGGGTGGGGIINGGNLTITNSTVSDNQTLEGNGRGGGILNGGFLSMTNVTIEGNKAQLGGGGLATFGEARSRNSLIVGNTSMRPAPDCTGQVISDGFNLIGNVGEGAPACILVNSMHDQVGTPSKPLDESKAKNAGDPANCPATDQRRFRRPVRGGCDIGATDSEARPDSTSTPGGNPVLTISQSTTLESDQKRAIVISRDYTLLDCKGHKIEGVDGTGVGIDLKGRTGVIVRNCVVTNFANGFNLEDSLLNVLYRNTASRNRNDGVHIVRSVGNLLDANTVEDNNDDGFDLEFATGNVFRSNVVRANRGSGFTLDYSAANFFANTFSRTNTGKGFQISHASRNNVFVRDSACNNLKTDVEENSNPNAFRSNAFCVVVGIRPGEEF